MNEETKQEMRSKSVLLPSSKIRKEFGKVYIQSLGDKVQVEFTVWMTETSEGWKTGLALDGSNSMKSWYGRIKIIDQKAWDHYMKKGLIQTEVIDGSRRFFLTDKALAHAKKKGYFTNAPNIVQPAARDFMGFLAEKMDVDSMIRVAYWACGDGTQFEMLGDIAQSSIPQVEIKGPENLGTGTYLCPILKAFVDGFSSAKRMFLVFITDGKLDDLNEVKTFTVDLAKKIESGQHCEVKCVLIGVGTDVDENQMVELDDLETGTSIDIWDHKIRKDMRDLNEITVELIDENELAASSAIIKDSHGNIVKKFTDGMPKRVVFEMPSSCDSFVLEVGDLSIKQTILVD